MILVPLLFPTERKNKTEENMMENEHEYGGWGFEFMANRKSRKYIINMCEKWFNLQNSTMCFFLCVWVWSYCNDRLLISMWLALLFCLWQNKFDWIWTVTNWMNYCSFLLWAFLFLRLTTNKNVLRIKSLRYYWLLLCHFVYIKMHLHKINGLPYVAHTFAIW